MQDCCCCFCCRLPHLLLLKSCISFLPLLCFSGKVHLFHHSRIKIQTSLVCKLAFSLPSSARTQTLDTYTSEVPRVGKTHLCSWLHPYAYLLFPYFIQNARVCVFALLLLIQFCSCSRDGKWQREAEGLLRRAVSTLEASFDCCLNSCMNAQVPLLLMTCLLHCSEQRSDARLLLAWVYSQP